MNLESAKIFLCIVICLTVCRCTRSQYFGYRPAYINFEDVTYDKVDDSIVVDANSDETRIAGGKYANHGDFPYMAVVHQLMGNGMISQCGGTVLSKRWVLTAGHCAVQYPRRFFVVFGIIDKSGIGYDSLQGLGVSMITTQAVVHPQYSESRNDIALLYMPQDIPFSRTIQPIKLAYYDDSFAHRNAHVIGWGKDHTNSKGTRKLKYATLPIIENNKCRQYWNRLTNKHICTAAGMGRDACQGDSGGPLVIEQSGQDLQVGIVSYGNGDCPSHAPGVFTRVSSFKNWIRDVTKIRI